MPTSMLRPLFIAALLAGPNTCAALDRAPEPVAAPTTPAPSVPRFDFRSEDLALLAGAGALAVICMLADH
ncbi:MAG: hypothetical protein Q7W29_04470, partial [bacterium]|nr:hypothetical protein [bacterium]